MTCPYNSHRTAIARRTLSAPMRYLKSLGVFGPLEVSGRKLRCLDYGCGRGSDARILQIHGWDPHHNNDVELVASGQSFDIITCNYVLNVLPEPNDRAAVIDNIIRLLAPKGTAYLTVRNDRLSLKGFTKAGTWQGMVEPDSRWQLIHSNSNFRLYSFTKENE